MTVSSNYSTYTSYNSAATSATVQSSKPDFETIAAEIMSSMDSDGSGGIDSSEFASALQSDKSADIFARIDTDSDGSMSSQEFMAALEASKPEHPHGAKEMGSMPPPPPPPSGGNESESDSQSQTYSALDTNQDGIVSLEELLSGVQEKSADSSSTSSEDKFSKLKTSMLENLLSYYTNTSSNSTSALNLSA